MVRRASDRVFDIGPRRQSISFHARVLAVALLAKRVREEDGEM
jgi:hypothetical protein